MTIRKDCYPIQLLKHMPEAYSIDRKRTRLSLYWKGWSVLSDERWIWSWTSDERKDGRYYAATGSKGYRWMESEMVKELGKEDGIDRSYYDKLVDEAVKNYFSVRRL